MRRMVAVGIAPGTRLEGSKPLMHLWDFEHQMERFANLCVFALSYLVIAEQNGSSIEGAL